jgi:N4-gp56 family major capsid protein
MKFQKFMLIPALLHVFPPDTNLNVTTDGGMSVEMKTFYDKNLLKNAFPKLIHNKFGQKRPIPAGGGKIIEFRKFTPLAKALDPLTEGVTPMGQKLAATSINATIAQYGAYLTFSDVLRVTTIDPALVEGTRMLGHQAGETLDTITREVLNGGSTVMYGDGTVLNRASLVGQDGTYLNNDYFGAETIRRALLTLRINKAQPAEGGDYVCIIHPALAYSLKHDSEWIEANKYNNADKIFDGEIGRYDGCRFYESTEAKVFAAPFLIASSKTLTEASLNTKTFTIDEALTAGQATALVGRKVSIKGVRYTIASAAAGSAGAATFTVTESVTGSPADGEIVYPADMGANLVEMPLNGVDVATALFFGADAYGVTEISGLGLTTIVKPLGAGDDPLNQRSTAGWKATHVAVRLSELWMVRVEVAIPYTLGAN